MTATMHPTDKVIEFNGVPARIWEGTTDQGTPIMAFITRVTPGECTQAQADEFREALQEVKAPSVAAKSIPLNLIL